MVVVDDLHVVYSVAAGAGQGHRHETALLRLVEGRRRPSIREIPALSAAYTYVAAGATRSAFWRDGSGG